jgi:hypothetical protein
MLKTYLADFGSSHNAFSLAVISDVLQSCTLLAFLIAGL